MIDLKKLKDIAKGLKEGQLFYDPDDPDVEEIIRGIQRYLMFEERQDAIQNKRHKTKGR